MSKNLKWAAFLIILSFSEVAVTILSTKWLGATLTYSLFAIPTIIGMFLHWHRWQKCKANWEFVFKTTKTKIKNKAEVTADENEAVVRFIWFYFSVILLLVPGFVSDVIAFGIFFKERSYGDQNRKAVITKDVEDFDTPS